MGERLRHLVDGQPHKPDPAIQRLVAQNGLHRFSETAAVQSMIGTRCQTVRERADLLCALGEVGGLRQRLRLRIADLPLDIDALDDDARIAELADELLTAKPHLRSRAIRERMGQGEGTASEGDGDLLSRMLGGRL